ncbi:MAG: sensor histidine kinase [Prochloraceae cyanobacterium]
MNEIEALKEELKQTQLAYRMAAQMSQFKAGFLARTYHELRSPLTSLIGLHQLILNNLCESPEEERQFLTQAYESAQKLMKLIDELVAVSQAEYGTAQLEIRPLQLASVLADVESLTYLQATHNHFPLEILFPDDRLYVKADRARLQQVLLTLIDTAISLMRKHSIQGSIQVSASVPPKSNLVDIKIDIQCPASIWSEPINLLEKIPETTPEAVKSFSKKLELSPGMKLLLCENLLETMEGNLLVLAPSSEENKQPLTRLNFSIPLASAEMKSG